VLGSFRDPAGFVFVRSGVPYRLVRPAFAPDYDHMLQSGFHAAAVAKGWLVPHEEVAPPTAELDEPYHRILRPEKLEFISYPYEWCFSQLRGAALLTLRLARLALDFGLTLKDASAYNVQFRGPQPIFIDTTSFVRAAPDQLWPAYYQFCRHFLAPLLLATKSQLLLQRELRVHLDGIPIDLASRLLPLSSWLQPSSLMHVHLHARAERGQGSTRSAGSDVSTQRRSAYGTVALLEHLIKLLERLEPPQLATEWGDYERATHYSENASRSKHDLVGSVCDELRPETVWDLGANSGRYSRLAESRGARTIAFDADPSAVERCYAESLGRPRSSLVSLHMDLTNPSPRLGWDCGERMSLRDRGPCDLALALALIHHLVLGRGIPFDALSEGMSHLARNLLVEWIPPADPMIAPLRQRRPQGAPDYDQQHFEDSFNDHFRLAQRWNLPESGRTLYLFCGKE